MRTTKNIHPSSVAGIAVVSMLCWAPLGVLAAQPVSNISDGISKGQIRALSADWWQWALSIPEAVHPLAFVGPQSADYCGVGQHGDVWFLGGVIATTPVDPIQGTVVRTCVVSPRDRNLFPRHQRRVLGYRGQRNYRKGSPSVR